MYVVDARGDVLLAGTHVPALDPDTRAVVSKLIGANTFDDVIFGLTGAHEVLRIVRLNGPSQAHAVFIEPIATRSPVAEAVKRFALSEREAEILKHLLAGASTVEMAAQLIIAASTVASHVRRIGIKMQASKRKEIVAAVLGRR
jgi:DNA-binding CsgD family transcriptional regulator